MLRIVATAVAALAAGGAPNVTDIARFYDVRGTTLSQLGPQLSRLNGEYTGRTEYRLGFTYRLQPVGSGCELRDLRVDLAVTTTMPRWVDQQRAPAAVQQTWRRFYDALARHEGNHRTIAINAGRVILQRLSGIRTSWPCARLRPWAKAEGKKQIAWADAENARYDARTQHGAMEGVTLTP